MAVTDICTNLLTNLTSSADRIRVPAIDYSEIVAELDKPAHLFAELYTLRYSEQIMIYGYALDAGVPYLLVQRGMAGTTARAWPDGACLRVLRSVDGRPCGADDDEQQDLLESLLAFLKIGRGLELIDDNGPTLRIADTGANPGVYGGAEVAATGQFISIPEGWPASAVPAFDNCCAEDPDPGPEPGGGGVETVEGISPDSAGDVSFCGTVPSDVPVTAATPVFVCSSGRMAQTTVGTILALVDIPEPPDLSGVVFHVGGLNPDGTGNIDFGDASTTTTMTGATVLLHTAGGVRRITLANLLAAAGDGCQCELDATFDPATGNLRLDLSGVETTVNTLPTFAASISGDDLVITHGPNTYPVTLPTADPPEVTLAISGSGTLTVGVDGVEASLPIPVVTAIPTWTDPAPPAGTNYKLIKTSTGQYYFVEDA